MVALILATVVWMLIKLHLQGEGVWEEENPPRAEPIPEEERSALDTL